MGLSRTAYRLRSGPRRLRRGMPQAAGLVAAWNWLGTPDGRDEIGGLQLTPQGSPTFDGALGLVTNRGTGVSSSCEATCPPGLRTTGSGLLLAWQGTQLATPSSPADDNAIIFGTSYNNVDASPFAAFQLCLGGAGFGSAGKYALDANYSGSGGIIQTVGPSVSAVGSKLFLAGGVRTDIGNNQLYVDNPIGENFTHGMSSPGITYGSTPILSFGPPSFLAGRNPGVAHEWGLIYNATFSDNARSNDATTQSLIRWLYNQGSDLWARTRDMVGWRAALGAAPFSQWAIGVCGCCPTITPCQSSCLPPAHTLTLSFNPNPNWCGFYTIGPTTCPFTVSGVAAGYPMVIGSGPRGSGFVCGTLRTPADSFFYGPFDSLGGFFNCVSNAPLVEIDIGSSYTLANGHLTLVDWTCTPFHMHFKCTQYAGDCTAGYTGCDGRPFLDAYIDG